MSSILDLAAATHVAASRLAAGHGWFPGWHERRFRGAISRFIDALERLSPGDVQRLSDSDRQGLVEMISAIAEDVDRHVSRSRSRRGLERARALVSQIYRLRKSAELVFHGSTPNPKFENVRLKLETDPTRQR